MRRTAGLQANGHLYRAVDSTGAAMWLLSGHFGNAYRDVHVEEGARRTLVGAPQG